MAQVTGTIIVKIQPKLLDYPTLSDFVDVTSRVMFLDGGSESFTFTQSSDGSQATANFSIYTMFPISNTRWSSYAGATNIVKATAALADPTFDFEIPARSEVQIYENGTLIFGGIITQVARERSGGAITTKITCQDYTALLDEVVIDRYKAPYDVKDYQIIKGGAVTDKAKNGLKILKLNDGGSGSTREITVSLEDAHDMIVGQSFIVDRTTNYNGTWIVSSILSEVSIKATASGTAPYTASSETSGRATPSTASLFSDVRTTDPYSGNSVSLGITYNSNYVQEELNDTRFSPVSYLPDPSYPAALGAKLWMPLSEYKTNRFSLDPVAADITTDMRCVALTSALNERYVISSISFYDTTNNYIEFTTLGNHSLVTGEYVNVQNMLMDSGKTSFTQTFRCDRQSSTVIRFTSATDPGMTVKKFPITASSSDGAYVTYTCANTLVVGDVIGISGITESGGVGSLNIAASVVEEATPTTFKVKNSSTMNGTNFSSAYVYATYIQLAQDKVQNLYADSKRFRIVAARRQDNVTQIWYNSTTQWFNQNEIIVVEGLADFACRAVISAVSGAVSDAYSTNPWRVYQYGRYGNTGVIGIAANVSPYAPKAGKSSGHPFEVGSAITISGLTGDASGLNGSQTIKRVKGNLIFFTNSGSNTGSSTNYIKSITSKSARLASSVTYNSGGVAWIKFSDTRSAADAAPGEFAGTAALMQFNYPWATSTGRGGAAVPSASFITAPEDSLTYIGGRQAVKFTSNGYQGLSSRFNTEIAYVQVASNVVTIYTKAPHRFREGQVANVRAVTKTAVNGYYEIDTVPDLTSFTYALTTANYTKTSDTGYADVMDTGFASLSKSFSVITVVQPTSFPASGYKTIWHHGSRDTNQRRELLIDSSGNIVFSTVYGTYYNTGLTLTVNVPSIIYVSLDSSTGTNNLTICKNDGTPYVTNATNYSGTTNAIGGPAASFTVGYGWDNSTVASKFYDGWIGDIIVIDRVLPAEERNWFIAWMAHYFALAGSLLSTASTYKLISDNPGRSEVSKVKEPFNGMTLRQAMDYISKKTGCQYWVDANKYLHYVKRDVKNLVENSVLEDEFGNASLRDWTFESPWTTTSRTGGPYGYGYAAVCSATTGAHVVSKKFPVTTGQVFFVSTMVKSGYPTKIHVKIQWYKSDGTEYTAADIGGNPTQADFWEKVWGVVKATDAQIAYGAVYFDHETHDQSYAAYFADPKAVLLDGEFGFADYGIKHGGTVEMLFDPALNAVIPMKTFETPQNISQHGSTANRVYIYAKPFAINPTGDLTTANVVTGQVLRYTFDHVQGVWNTHGKIIESAIVNKEIETPEDASLAAQAIFADSGKTIESYEIDHPTAASDGRLTVGSVIPFFWTEVDVVEPVVVKSQTTKFIGGEAYYSVQLSGEPALESNAIVLVQREQLTVNLGPGQLALTRPTRVSNIVVNSKDQDGKATTVDLAAVINWTFDQNNPRNKLVKRFEIERRSQELKKNVLGQAALRKSGTAISRGSAVAGGVSSCYVYFNQSTNISAGDIIQIAGWVNPAKKNLLSNPSFNGYWTVDHVSRNGQIVYFNMYAPENAAIAVYSAAKSTISTKFTVSWYETVKAGQSQNKWGSLGTVPFGGSTYTDTSSDYTHRYQYRIRAVAETADGGKLYGDWSYIPQSALSSIGDDAWLYITRDLSLASDGGTSINDASLETT
jgi:hypothetical protein